MRRTSQIRFAGIDFKTRVPGCAILCATIFLCVASAACSNSCVLVVWNFGGAISTGNPSCSLGTASGAINLRLNSSVVASAAPSAPNLKHIFVTLRGIEARPGANADGTFPDWQELAPELQMQPAQVDLMAAPADSCASHVIGRSVVPADVYREVRLRVGPDHPAGDEAVPKQNQCGDAGFNCVITTTDEIQTLHLDGAAPDLHIGPEGLTGGFFRVVPDQETNLSLEFNPYASLAVPSSEGLRVVPVFTIAPTASCESPEPLHP